MIDVETRARRAGEAARTEAAALVDRLEVPGSSAPMRRERRVVGRPLAGALTGALAVLLVVLLVGQLNAPGVLTIDPAAPDLSEVVSEPVAVDGVLPVPPVGEAIAAYLDEGTPVFVSHPEDGDVYVFGAAFPGGGRRQLLGWCPSSGWFEDLYHGARFNAWGDYTGGPAPYAMIDLVSSVSEDGSTVRVSGTAVAVRPRTDRRAEQPMRGPNCDDGSVAAAPEAVVHEPPAEVPTLDGTQIPGERWVWARIRFGGAPGDLRVCDADGACPQKSPRVADVLPGTTVAVPDRGPLVLGLVRRTDEGVALRSHAFPDHDDDAVVDEDTSLALLPLPVPGEVVAEWYGAERSPVFVTRDDDGEVHVLDATSQHLDRNLVGWCASSRSFGDTHGARWSLSGGYVGGPGRGDLRRYPAEIVTQGELSAVRVTGDLGPELDRSSPVEEPGPYCDTDTLLRHLPGEGWNAPAVSGAQSVGEGWRWMHVAIDEVDGDLRLCVIGGPQACGEPGPEPHPTNADCIDDVGGVCPPEEDPFVVTEWVTPTDGPALMLVRAASAGGGAVEVRFPAEFDGA